MVTVSEYSTAYGLEPGPKGVVVCLVFERSSRDNTHCSEGENPSQVQHQYFFLNISFFVHEVYEKIKWA